VVRLLEKFTDLLENGGEQEEIIKNHDNLKKNNPLLASSRLPS
jgi:hypothetical protein